MSDAGTNTAVIKDLEAALAACKATVARKQARIDYFAGEAARLTKLLSEPDEDQRPTRTVIGSSAQPGNLDAFKGLEAKVGKLGAWRIFIAGTKPGPYDVERIRVCLDGGRRPFVSVTGGVSTSAATDAAKEYVRLIKPLGGAGVITFGHEPTQKFSDPKAYVAAKNAYYRVLRAELPSWDCVDIFMLYDIVAGGPRHPDNWMADRSLLDGIGIDAYDQGKKQPGDMLAPALALADKHQLPLYITETSTVEKPDDPNYKPNWIRAMAEFCRNEPRIPTWIWFHSKVGPNAPDYGWFVTTSDGATRAFAQAVNDQWTTSSEAL